MRKLKHIQKAHQAKNNENCGFKLAAPFIVVMAILTVISFIIPLRPTVSMSEKRELHKFPEFSVEAIVNGDYFDNITLWFSDTFPGRESWISLSDFTNSLHGYSEVSFVEDDFVSEIVNPVPDETQSMSTDAVPEQTEVTETATTLPEIIDETVPAETEWGGIDAGNDAEIYRGAIIQIGDTAFNSLGFSKYVSARYTTALSNLADYMADKNIRVISAPAPTAVGIMIESEYLDKFGCADQNMIIHYLHDTMSENVIAVDTYAAMIPHNNEYVYFRTDHHWTARGAYYVYKAIVEELGMEAALLESFEEWDQGEFRGSLYTKAPYKNKLKPDNVYAYVPQGNITTQILYPNYTVDGQLIHDKTQSEVFSKYLAFLGTDYELMKIVNNNLPEGTTCLIVKDSFGNCFAPFMTQNYHTVYVMDYRKYHNMTIQKFVDAHEVDDVIFIPYLIATQSEDGAKHFERLSHIYAEKSVP